MLLTAVLGRHTASVRCGSPPLALAQARRVSSVSGNDSALTLQGRGYLWGAFLGMAWGAGCQGLLELGSLHTPRGPGHFDRSSPEGGFPQGISVTRGIGLADPMTSV